MSKRKLMLVGVVSATLACAWAYLSPIAWEFYCNIPFVIRRRMQVWGREFDQMSGSQLMGVNPAYSDLPAPEIIHVHGSVAERLAEASEEVRVKARRTIEGLSPELRAKVDPPILRVVGLA